MVDAALIETCADPSLQLAIVEKFIAQAGSPDPLAVTVKSGDRLILVPSAKSQDEAMEIIRQYAGHAVVRVGITQMPAGISMKDISELKTDLVDPCQNIRMGTALFAKVYRIVVRWYGAAPAEAFDDAVYAWTTGYFEGKSVFRAPDPGGLTPPSNAVGNALIDKDVQGSATTAPLDAMQATDFARAGMRVDLSRISAGNKSDYEGRAEQRLTGSIKQRKIQR